MTIARLFSWIATAGVAWLLAPATAAALGEAPSAATCADEAALASAPRAVQGGCIVIHRRKGNCNACHLIAGVSSGDIAPPLTFMANRFPDKAWLRSQIEDARRANPATVMPPFGAHHILAPDEIDKVVEFLLTL